MSAGFFLEERRVVQPEPEQIHLVLGPAEGSVIIPAHNEANVIARTLSSLAALAADRRLEVVVACNGCTDDTAAIARGFEGVVVLEIAEPSKVAALNAGDAVASAWPRLYLDADIEMSADSVMALFAALGDGSGTRAVRPAVSYDSTGAPAVVRSYYRARMRSSATARAVWGAGAYALSREGRQAFEEFPVITSDDMFVDWHFEPELKQVVTTASSVVRTPRSLEGLMSVLQRTFRGNHEIAQWAPGRLKSKAGSGATLRALLTSTRGPQDLVDSAVYVGFSLLGRRIAARAAATASSAWERDGSSREPATTSAALPGTGVRACDHVLLTRFNLPSRGVESMIRAKDGWLATRIELFERYCVPSVRAQRNQNFSWIIYLDPASPLWLLDRLAPYVTEGLFTPVFREEVSREELLGDIRAVVGPTTRPDLITTNLDNDDGLAVDFVERLQAADVPGPRAAVYLSRGLIRQGRSVFVRTDRHNAFCSVRESWQDPVTCWADWHNRLPLQMPAVDVAGEPAWLQVVHDTNVSNRVVGRRVDPEPHRPRFGSGLDEVEVPSRGSLAADAYLLGPARHVRELVRAGAKGAVLAVGGTRGLDAAKLVARRVRRLGASTVRQALDGAAVPDDIERQRVA
jgi:N-acetylglucosaminyl-diphospho-decaprenol L-rhamnosyltransferase